MSDKKSSDTGGRGSAYDDDVSCEVAMPSGGLSIRRSREVHMAENKHPPSSFSPSSSSSSSSSHPFDPRTISCDSLLYSGEVPISSLPPSLPFPQEISGDPRELHRDRDRDRDRRSDVESKDSRGGGESRWRERESEGKDDENKCLSSSFK
jgi:hypothetical protein